MAATSCKLVRHQSHSEHICIISISTAQLSSGRSVIVNRSPFPLPLSDICLNWYIQTVLYLDRVLIYAAILYNFPCIDRRRFHSSKSLADVGDPPRLHTAACQSFQRASHSSTFLNIRHQTRGISFDEGGREARCERHHAGVWRHWHITRTFNVGQSATA